MKSVQSNIRIIGLDNVRQNNIVLVDLSKSLTESIFGQEYQKAASIIRKIIADNNAMVRNSDPHCLSCKSRDCDRCRFCDDMYSLRMGGTWQNLTKCQTAVPFIGDRGTGKTSVMCSILERLKNYRGDDQDAAFNLGSDLGDPRFITFDMIDANTLKKTDDVMEIILARMLTYLEDLQADNECRELYRQIDELHENLCLVDKEKQGKREEYGLVGLQRIANSQNAVDDFRRLVDDFNHTIRRARFPDHPCYLVIALDDIDMYCGSDGGMQDSQFALMEHIYKHMRIPGLIVLMTYNELILKRTCNRHFESIYFGKQRPGKYSKLEQEAIDTLTGQFMSKLFPHEQRIYMPNNMLINSAEHSNLYVRPVLHENNRMTVIAPFAKNMIVPIKKFMLRLIAYKTGVYFDAIGSKKHFFEPGNLRELGELFQIIYTMEDIPKKPALQESARGRNRQVLLSYLYNQFAFHHLGSEEYEQFRSLSVLPLTRQCKWLIDMIHQQRLKVAVREDSVGYLVKYKKDQWKYSYGELLHNIYLSTRIPKEDGNGTYFSKAFVHCILGTYSMLLNETVCAHEFDQSILPLLGSSIAGRWANEMLPDLTIEGYSGAFGGGSISLPIRDFFNWQIPEKVQTALLGLYAGNDSANKQELHAFLEALILTGMFFTKFPATGLGIVLDADINAQQKPGFYLRSESEEHVCFNIMNFVINLSNYTKSENGRISFEYLDYIQGKLEKLGKELLMHLNADLEENYQKAEQDKKDAENQRNTLTIFAAPLSGFELERKVTEYQREVKRASAWISITKTNDIKKADDSQQEAFMRCWNELLQSIVSDFSKNITERLNSHEEFRFVLPVQNFDMMYNIIKRLADCSYRDIPEDVHLSKIYDYYVRLYKDLEKELQKQDKAYSMDDSNGFAAAFRDTLFFRIITAKKGEVKYNPYIKSVLVSMIRSTAGAQIERKNKGRI